MLIQKSTALDILLNPLTWISPYCIPLRISALNSSLLKNPIIMPIEITSISPEKVRIASIIEVTVKAVFLPGVGIVLYLLFIIITAIDKPITNIIPPENVSIVSACRNKCKSYEQDCCIYRRICIATKSIRW